jgi:SAM-dependent methyltransferase
VSSTPPPGQYDSLDFNAPMSNELADSLAASLARHSPRTVVDVGCGWAELLLRVLAAAPDARGLGVDRDEQALARGRRNATTRGLANRVELRAALPDAATEAADAVLCIGADHIFGTQTDALQALSPLVRPGGRLVFGTGYWEATPTAEQAASLGYVPSDLLSLADLVELAITIGFRPLDLRTATRREWEAFELGFLADWEEWLMRYGDRAEAAEIRGRSDEHRTGYLRHWRDLLGFAYLTLGRAA